MATNINDLIAENTFSATTLTSTTIFLGLNNITDIFAQNVNGGYLPISGGTVTGATIFSNNLSATTLFSGASNLYSIFSQIGSTVSSIIPGANIITGGTSAFPTISLVASPSINALIASGTSQLDGTTSTTFSGGTISGGTIYSGNTNLSNIFLTLSSLLTGYAIAGSGTTSALTASNTILQGFQNLERLIKNFDIQIISTTASTTTTSTTYVDIPGVSAQTKNIGQTGKYIVIFNGGVQISTTNRYVGVRIIADENIVFASEKFSTNVQTATNRHMPLVTVGTVSLDSDKVIKIQWETEVGTATLFNNSLILIGIPNNYII